MKAISIRFEDGVYEKLKETAKDEDRSFNRQVNNVIKRYFKLIESQPVQPDNDIIYPTQEE